MRTFAFEGLPRLAALGTLLLAAVTRAQDGAATPEVKPMCQAVIAIVMVGKPTCTAALCNTGASQGGFTGFLSQVANRGAIDGASFSVGVGTQLATALTQTGCFTVLDSASIEETKKEMEALGKPIPPLPAIDYLIRSSVTKAEYVLDESGFLGFKTVTAKSSLTIDTKLVNANTGAMSEAGTYDATIERKSSGVSLGIYRSNDDAAKRGTPFADVTRDVIVKAAVGLTTKIVSQAGTSRPSATVQRQPPATESPASSPQ